MRAELVDKARRALARSHHPRSVRSRRTTGILSVCFDDFPKSAWTEGGHVLADHGVRGTYFVAGSLCGTQFDGERMYDVGDLEALHAAGHEIGCHTFEHASCMRATPRDLAISVEKNAAFVRDRLGDVRLVSFAYPYGDASISTKQIVARRFACARGVDPGLNSDRLRLAQLKAVGFQRSEHDLKAVEVYIERAAASGAWLILFTHDVSDRPGPYGCRPDELDAALRSARAAGLEILTVKGALGRRVFT